MKSDKRRAAQESYRDGWRSYREKMGRAKAQLELKPGYCHKKPIKKYSINTLTTGVGPILGVSFCSHLCPSAHSAGYLEDSCSYCWRLRQRRNFVPQPFPHPLWLRFALHPVKDGAHGIMEWFGMQGTLKLISFLISAVGRDTFTRRGYSEPSPALIPLSLSSAMPRYL